MCSNDKFSPTVVQPAACPAGCETFVITDPNGKAKLNARYAYAFSYVSHCDNVCKCTLLYITRGLRLFVVRMAHEIAYTARDLCTVVKLSAP